MINLLKLIHIPNVPKLHVYGFPVAVMNVYVTFTFYSDFYLSMSHSLFLYLLSFLPSRKLCFPLQAQKSPCSLMQALLSSASSDITLLTDASCGVRFLPPKSCGVTLLPPSSKLMTHAVDSSLYRSLHEMPR